MIILKKIFEINNLKASSFSISHNNDLCYNIDNFCILLDKNFQKLNLKFSENYFGYIYEDFVWINDLNSVKSIILNNDFETVKELDYEGGFSGNFKKFSFNNFIFPITNSTRNYENEKYSKINTINYNIENQYDFNIGFNGIQLIINEQLFISSDQLKIGLFNFENEAIWQHSYTDLLNEEDTTISTEIVEISGVIYFLLHGGGKHECFGLDANTGQVVKRIPNIVGDIIVKNEFIYFLHSEVITIYNTQKGEIITWEIEDLMVETGIERLWFPRWAIHDELIYFSQSKGADRNSDNIGARFGVLDPTKKELLWQDKLPLENGIIGSIKVNQNRIYLHTQDQTLLIYEKE